jgi:tRNA A37 methylthiotransferase MiaB
MSRTRRYSKRENRRVRDGYPLHVSAGCQHHNACAYCRGNRTHGNRRREPMEVR